jgi:hypothetical protein
MIRETARLLYLMTEDALFDAHFFAGCLKPSAWRRSP